jgi:hypothetical protein
MTPSINDVRYEHGTPVHNENPAARLAARKLPLSSIKKLPRAMKMAAIIHV